MDAHKGLSSHIQFNLSSDPSPNSSIYVIQCWTSSQDLYISILNTIQIPVGSSFEVCSLGLPQPPAALADVLYFSLHTKRRETKKGQLLL